MRTAWVHCWITLHSASRKARTTTTVCRIFPAKTAGSSWIPPFVCGFCWTRKSDAAKPLDLLGNTSNPGAARRACNAVRTARNEAAHATDHTDAAQAAILFNEAVESLEDGYVGTAFRENELARYYRDAENYLARCGAKEPIASSRAPEEKNGCARASPPEHKAGPEPQHPEPQNGRQPFLRQQKHHSAQQLGQKPQHGRPQKRNREELAIKPCSSFCWWSCCWGLPCVHGAWAQPDRL